METLVEFAQGCPPNQRDIFDARVVDDINSLLRSPELQEIKAAKERVGQEYEKVAHLHLACANLLLAMLENSGEETRKTALEIEATLDIPRAFETLHRYRKWSSTVRRNGQACHLPRLVAIGARAGGSSHANGVVVVFGDGGGGASC
jgi:hypothetical protein